MIKFYKSNLNFFLIGFMLLGVLAAFIFPFHASYFNPLGVLFLNALKLLIVPIVFFAMLVGILNLSSASNLTNIVIRAMIFYAATTALAVALGIMLVNVFEPGKLVTPLEITSADQASGASDHSLLSVLYKIIPTNILQAGSTGNVLGIIFFSVFFGLAILKSTNKTQLEDFKNLVNTITDALIWMVNVIMLYAPLGVFALLYVSVASAIKSDIFSNLGAEVLWYFLTVSFGLIVHGAITLSVILLFFRKNPIKFFLAMFPAITTAFSTASSTATLPITIDSLETRANVSPKSASFIAPLGATINMDGTAIYEAIAAIFIANLYGIDLNFTQQFTIFITATVSAVGAAGIPGAGLIMMTMVLGSVGIPEEGIALIIGVDRLLDMLRTAVNVWGDSVGAYVLDWED